MINRSSYSPVLQRRANSACLIRALLAVLLCSFPFVPGADAGDAPSWLHVLVNASLPAHDERTDAVLLYSEETVTIISADKMKGHVRAAYKILRPGGREYGLVGVPFNPHKKVTNFHGWSIPQNGKDYEVSDKDALGVSPRGIEYGELMTDVKYKVLEIPARDPGNVIGYEYDTEEQPLLLQKSWDFQGEIPAIERHYTLSLPSQWEYRAVWLNHPEVQPTEAAKNQW